MIDPKPPITFGDPAIIRELKAAQKRAEIKDNRDKHGKLYKLKVIYNIDMRCEGTFTVCALDEHDAQQVVEEMLYEDDIGDTLMRQCNFTEVDIVRAEVISVKDLIRRDTDTFPLFPCPPKIS